MKLGLFSGGYITDGTVNLFSRKAEKKMEELIGKKDFNTLHLVYWRKDLPCVFGYNFSDDLYMNMRVKVPKKLVGKILSYIDVVTIPGGNTFEISKWMQENGYYDLVKKAAEMGKVIFGTSAGAIMMSPTIMSAQWADPMEPFINEIPTTNGLNFVPFLIKPHSEGYFPEYHKRFQDFCDKEEKTFECIGDGGCIIINGDEITKIGYVKTLNPGDAVPEYPDMLKYLFGKSAKNYGLEKYFA